MIQAPRTSSTQFCVFYLDVYPYMTSIDYVPMFSITSHQTNRTKSSALLVGDFSKKERYVRMIFSPVATSGNENLEAGLIYIGTKEFPYGLYDFTLYQNSSDTNYNPASAVKVIYQGLMNLEEIFNPSVTYNKYESTQQQNVYITNTYI